MIGGEAVIDGHCSRALTDPEVEYDRLSFCKKTEIPVQRRVRNWTVMVLGCVGEHQEHFQPAQWCKKADRTSCVDQIFGYGISFVGEATCGIDCVHVRHRDDPCRLGIIPYCVDKSLGVSPSLTLLGLFRCKQSAYTPM